jgi:hypothetical protein
MSLQSCMVISCKSPTLGDETCNLMHCSPVKKTNALSYDVRPLTPFHTALGP